MGVKIPGADRLFKKTFSSLMRDIPSKVKYLAGLNPKKVGEVKPSMLTKRREAGLTTPQVYNPFVSRNAGRYTIPRVVGIPAVTYGAYQGAKNVFGGNGADTNTADYTDYLNNLNNQIAQERLQSQFAPQTNYNTLSDILTGLTEGFTPYSAGGAPAGSVGSTTDLFNNPTSMASGYDTTQGGAVTGAQNYANQIADIVNQYSSSYPKSSSAGKKSGNTVNDMVKAAAGFAAVADAAAAKRDYRDYLLNAIKTTGENPYLSPSFTGQEQGLGNVYDEWTSLTPVQKEELQRNYGVYSPYDLYQLRRAQNPQQYGG